MKQVLFYRLGSTTISTRRMQSDLPYLTSSRQLTSYNCQQTNCIAAVTNCPMPPASRESRGFRNYCVRLFRDGRDDSKVPCSGVHLYYRVRRLPGCARAALSWSDPSIHNEMKSVVINFHPSYHSAIRVTHPPIASQGQKKNGKIRQHFSHCSLHMPLI
jgi:hypothetical protein